MQGGDFTGAMQGFANAATSANTKSEKNYAAAGTIISGLAGIADIWQKSAQAKRERKEQKAVEQLEADWKKATEFASSETNEGYQNAVNIMLPYVNELKLNGVALNNIGIWCWKLKDYSNTWNCFATAAGKENVDAIFNLGILCETGQGLTSVSYKDAVYWYKKACDMGYEPACKKADEANIKAAKAKIELDKLKPVETGQSINDTVTVQTILNHYVTAIGGYDEIKGIKTVEQVEEGPNGSSRIIRGYGKFYSEGTTSINTSYKTVFNGSTGYSIYNGEKTNLDEKRISLYKQIQPFSVLGLSQQELKVGKMESLAGTDCFTLVRATYDDATSINLVQTHYFSKGTGLYLGMKSIAAGKTSAYTSYLLYDDYRSLGGVLFPFSRVSFSNDDAVLTKYTIKEININNPASEEYFK